jgi:hypothetical protein
VLVCDAEEGLTTMTWADSLDLEKWLADYSLDELWAMNVIGDDHEAHEDRHFS